MKLALVGDMHLTLTLPKRRKDDYVQAMLGKLDAVFRIAEKYNCNGIFQAGDMFHSPRESLYLLGLVIEKIYGWRSPGGEGFSKFITVYGQHDLWFHSLKSKAKTPIALLEKVGVLDVANTDSPIFVSLGNDIPGAWVYGASWGEEIPKSDPKEGRVEVLIVHAPIMIQQLYPGHKFRNPDEFKGKGFDLVLCGDYHYRFERRVGDTLVVNPGVMMRRSISEADVEPAVAIYDTETREVEWVPLPAKPFEEVFDLSDMAGKDEELDKEELLALIESLKETGVGKADPKEIILELCKEAKASDRVREIIAEALEAANV